MKNTALTQTLGKVKLSAIEYDADQQKFSLEISAQNGTVLTRTSIQIPIAQAKDIKVRLLASEITILFKVIKDAQLHLEKILLVDRNNDMPSKSVIYEPRFNQLSFDIKKSDVEQWNKQYQKNLAKKKKRQLEEQKIIEKQQLIAKKELAKKYPYEATFSCNLGRLIICLGKYGTINYLVDNQTTELSTYDLSSMDELTIPLSKIFTIMAQNGSLRNRTLSLEVTDLITGKVLYSEQTSTPSGVIKVKS